MRLDGEICLCNVCINLKFDYLKINEENYMKSEKYIKLYFRNISIITKTPHTFFNASKIFDSGFLDTPPLLVLLGIVT